MAAASEAGHPHQQQHLKAPITKRLWPFKKSPKAACAAHRSRTPSPCPSPSPASPDLPSPAPTEKTLLWLSLSPQKSSSTKGTPVSSAPDSEDPSMRPDLPPKDAAYMAQQREQRQARRRGVLHPPFSHLPILDQRSPRSPASTHRSARSSSSPGGSTSQREKAESGLERIASFLRWNRSGPFQEGEHLQQQPQQRYGDYEADKESLVSASEIPVRSFAASRSSSSSNRAPPPIFIPRPKVTLTAANGSPRPELSPRPASTEPTQHHQPFLRDARPRLSAPAIITPSNSLDTSVYSAETSDVGVSSANSSSLAHVEIGAAQRLSVAPARVISNLLAVADLGDEIKTAMETPLSGISMPRTDQVGSPSDEGFPAGPLSAKSAVYAGTFRHTDAPRFDLDVLLHSPATTEKDESKTSCDLDEVTQDPSSACEEGIVKERPSCETVSSVGSATTFRSQSTAATSLASATGLEPDHHFPQSQQIILDGYQPSEMETLAEPASQRRFAVPDRAPTPSLSLKRTAVSQLSSDELNTPVRMHVLESMRTLVTEDPRLLDLGALPELGRQLEHLEQEVPRLKREQQHLLTAQAALLAQAARALTPSVVSDLEDNQCELVHASHRLIQALHSRENLQRARLEHLAASATLSLGKLNSSFVLNKERLSKTEQRVEDMKIQRSAADLRISQLQHRLKLKDNEIRRLKAINRQLQDQDTIDGLSLRRPSDAGTLHEIPADPSACLSSEFGRALGLSSMTPSASPTFDIMSKPLPRSPSLDSLTRDQLPPRTSSRASYRFPPVPELQRAPISYRGAQQQRSVGNHTRPNSISSVGHSRIGLKALEDMLDGSFH